MAAGEHALGRLKNGGRRADECARAPTKSVRRVLRYCRWSRRRKGSRQRLRRCSAASPRPCCCRHSRRRRGWLDLGAHPEQPHCLRSRWPSVLGAAGTCSNQGWSSVETGWRLQPALRAGRSLVDRDGHLWRWTASLLAGLRAAQRCGSAIGSPPCAVIVARSSAALAQQAAAHTAREAAVAVRSAIALRRAEDRLSRDRAWPPQPGGADPACRPGRRRGRVGGGTGRTRGPGR